MPVLALLAALLAPPAPTLGEPAPPEVLDLAQPYPDPPQPPGARPLEPVRIAFLAPFTILLDNSGVVRRLHSGPRLDPAALGAFVAQWRQGKSLFEASCARCHGNDGALHICDDVKPLTGIGRRLSPEEIRRRLRPAEVNEREVVIRATFFKRPDVDALIAYIAGL
jgi:mono/diheme cytochrome c family protein